MSSAWVTAHTDGSATIDGVRGGWAFVLGYNGHKLIRCGCIRPGKGGKVTSNQMEMQAAIKALQKVRSGSLIALYSDSQYLVFGMTDKDRKRNANKNLWQALEDVCAQHKQVIWNWIPRDQNAEADKAAKSALGGKTLDVRTKDGQRKSPVRRTIYHPDLAKADPG